MKSFNNLKDELRREEEDIAKAIELSLKETPDYKQEAQSNLYGLLPSKKNNNSSFIKQNDKEKKKVKAIYDFEAAEDNEITFKAGDILYIIDETDRNWWKGFDDKGNEGLFPSNFVTSDLTYNVENYESNKTNKKVSFNENLSIKEVDTYNVYQKVIQNVIDEKKIDQCNELLQNADPTGEIQSNNREMLELEDQCYMMGPLIDKQLQKIDHKHTILEDLNLKILEAFQTYNNLMKDSINKSSNIAPIQNLNAYSNMNLTSINTTTSNINQVPYIASPPSFDQNAFLNGNVANNVNLNIAPLQNSTTTSYGNLLTNSETQYIQSDNQVSNQIQSIPFQTNNFGV